MTSCRHNKGSIWMGGKGVKASGIRGMLADVREFTKLTKLHGGLVPMSAVATILGVSRQRVHQLVDEGTFKHCTFYGMKWLSQEEVVSFAKLNRHKGENQYTPSTKQLWKESRDMGKKFVQNRCGSTKRGMLEKSSSVDKLGL